MGRGCQKALAKNLQVYRLSHHSHHDSENNIGKKKKGKVLNKNFIFLTSSFIFSSPFISFAKLLLLPGTDPITVAVT